MMQKCKTHVSGPIWYAKICQQHPTANIVNIFKPRFFGMSRVESGVFHLVFLHHFDGLPGELALWLCFVPRDTKSHQTVRLCILNSPPDIWNLEKTPPLQFSYVLHSLYTITPIHIDTFRIFQARILLVLPVPYNVNPDCPTTQKLSNICAFASGPFMNNMTGEKFTSAFSPWSKQHHETSVHSSRNTLKPLSSYIVLIISNSDSQASKRLENI